MKTVSQLSGADILCTYKPNLPLMAIVDTEICFVENIMMLKAIDEKNVPSQAFIVVARDGNRFVEIDTNSKEYDGTAWALNSNPHSPYITFAQLRFITKNTITALRDNYEFAAVLHSLIFEFHHAHIQGIRDAGSRSVLGIDHHNFETYLRTVCEDLVVEIRQEREQANSGTNSDSTVTTPNS